MRPSEALSLHRTQIREIALRHRVSGVRVFGSALHGDDTADSDLDLLSSTLPARKWLIPLETDIKPQTTKRAWRGLMGSVVSNPGPQKVTSVRA